MDTHWKHIESVLDVVLVAESDAFWNAFATLRTDRAWGERLRGNYE